ncbi:MAG: hypothetical protein RJQ09_21250 [Cyclobacteriaceae bacterium]
MKHLKAIYTLLIAAVLLSGCVTYRKCFDKYALLGDSTTVTVRDTLLVPVEVKHIVEGDKVEVNLDSLLKAMQLDGDSRLAPLSGMTDSIWFVMEEQRGRIGFWRDKYNRLQARAECFPDTVLVRDTIPVPYEVQVPCPPQAVFDEANHKTWFDKVLDKLEPIFWVLAVAIGITLYMRWRRSKIDL